MKAPSAIAAAVLARLRSQVTHVVLDAYSSGVEQDGRPPPRAPQVYISLNEPATRTKGSRDGYPQNLLERKFAFVVFISCRTGVYHPDQIEEIYNRATGGMDLLESQVIAALHDNQTLRQASVSNLDANEEPFLYPPYYQGRPGTEVHDAGWSHEENTGDDGEVVGWLVRRLSFDGFDRIEYSSEIA